MVTVLVIVTGLPLASVPVMVNTTSVPGATSVVVPVMAPVSTISTVIAPATKSRPVSSGVLGSLSLSPCAAMLSVAGPTPWPLRSVVFATTVTAEPSTMPSAAVTALL